MLATSATRSLPLVAAFALLIVIVEGVGAGDAACDHTGGGADDLALPRDVDVALHSAGLDVGLLCKVALRAAIPVRASRMPWATAGGA